MLWLPAASAVVVQPAVRMLPLPANAAALHPAIEAAPSRKLTVPVGAVPLTVAVKVTLAPGADGLAELATPVVLAALLTV